MHLSLAEHGAYSILLDVYYATETPLPADLDALHRMCRAMTQEERAAVQAVADRFFKVGEDGFRHNPRADREIKTARETVQKQRESGVESARKRWSSDRSTHKSTHNLTTGLAMQPPTTNHQEKPKPSRALRSGLDGLNGAFTAFWEAYPRKKSKGDAEKAWLKIRPDEQLASAILAAVERAKTSADWKREGGQFIPYPATWLNAKGWEDQPPQLAPQEKRLAI